MYLAHFFWAVITISEAHLEPKPKPDEAPGKKKKTKLHSAPWMLIQKRISPHRTICSPFPNRRWRVHSKISKCYEHHDVCTYIVLVGRQHLSFFNGSSRGCETIHSELVLCSIPQVQKSPPPPFDKQTQSQLTPDDHQNRRNIITTRGNSTNFLLSFPLPPPFLFQRNVCRSFQR